MVRLADIYAREGHRISGLADGAGDYLHPVFGEGPEQPFAMLIGEAPGADEARQGRPFVGRAGRQLDDMLVLARIDRGELFVTNAVKFRPVKANSPRKANRTPTLSEVKAALPALDMEIKLLAPMVIVTLGNTPLKAVCRLAGIKCLQIGDAHGKPVRIELNGRDTVLYPQYHPASVIYNRGLKQVLEQDLVSLGAYIAERRCDHV